MNATQGKHGRITDMTITIMGCTVQMHTQHLVCHFFVQFNGAMHEELADFWSKLC